MDKEEARKALGQRVRRLRKEQNLTLRKFGLMVGLSKDYVVDIEFGRKSPTLDTIIKIASGLDVTPAALLEGVGEPPDAPPRAKGEGTIRYDAARY